MSRNDKNTETTVLANERLSTFLVVEGSLLSVALSADPIDVLTPSLTGCGNFDSDEQPRPCFIFPLILRRAFSS